MYNRNLSIDIVKGIAIILVIIGHSLLAKEVPFLRHFIFSFHMPLFFIIGGCFYKPKNIKEQFIKDTKRLLLPYFSSGIILMLVQMIYQGNWMRPLSLLCPTGFWRIPNLGALWFLLSLFWCREFYNINIAIEKYIKDYKPLITWCAIIIISGISVYLRTLIEFPLGVLEGMQCLIFYHLGNVFLKDGTLQNTKHLNSFWIVIMSFILWGLQIRFAGLELMWCHYTIYPLDIAGSFCATIIMLYIANYISKIKKLASILSWFGNNSLLILCIHASMNVITIHVSNKWGGANTTISDKFRYYSNKPIGLHFKAI